MTVRIALANQKGGVGKSTMTLQIAYYAAVVKGMKVLITDMDGQGNTSTKIAGRKQIEDLPEHITRSVHLFKPDLEAVNVLKCQHGIHLIPAKINDDLLYAQEAAPLNSIVYPSMNLETVAENYDLVLIDCPPSLGRLLSAGLIMADKVIMPIQVSGFAVDGVGGLFKVIEKMNASGKDDLEVAGILINCYNARSNQHKMAVKALRAKVGDLVMDTVIGNRSPIDQATNQALPIWELKSGAARPAKAELTAAIEDIFKRTGVSQ